jgi:hypothetical protein
MCVSVEHECHQRGNDKNSKVYKKYSKMSVKQNTPRSSQQFVRETTPK